MGKWSKRVEVKYDNSTSSFFNVFVCFLYLSHQGFDKRRDQIEAKWLIRDQKYRVSLGQKVCNIRDLR
jgi:hypothetical protein